MELYEQLIGFARAYPLIISMSCFITYFLTNNIDLLLLTVFILLNDSVNHVLKYYICKPLLGGKKWPIIGSGNRPDGAKYCDLFVTGKGNGKPSSTSYGMPSGHSQNAAFFSSYVILNLLNNPFSNSVKIYGTIIFISLAIGIMYSRVILKCHTVQQVIAGGLIGSVLGAVYFKNKDKIKKLINL